MKQYSLKLFALGLLALGLGLLIYLVLRPQDSSYLNHYLSFYQFWPSPPVFNSLPSLFHVLAFSLFSISVLGRNYAFHSCLFWFLLNVAFELLQHPVLSHLDFPGILGAYARGTFDYLDILVSFIGACLALIINHLLERGRDVSS